MIFSFSKYWCGIIAISLFFGFTESRAQSPDSRIKEVIAKVNLDTLISYVRILSGEDSVRVNGKMQLIAGRKAGTPIQPLPGDFIKQTLSRFGLKTSEHIFAQPVSGRNILAVKQGIDTLAKYMICAHYDSYCATGNCPGADDNASGTAAVLEAARLLSKLVPDHSILFALWDQEERGLYGSSVYASLAKASGYNIQGVLNLDMLAWDSNADMNAEIHSRNIANSGTLLQKISDINTNYSIGLNLSVVNPGSTASDQASFWNQGFTAIMLIESFSDFNLYYHTVNDKISQFNLSYFHKMAKLAVAGILSMASDDKSITNFRELNNSSVVLEQNFPNPVRNSTVFRFFLPEQSMTYLKIYNLSGVETVVLVSESLGRGIHQVTWGPGDSEAGIYFYRLQAGGTTLNRKMVVLK